MGRDLIAHLRDAAEGRHHIAAHGLVGGLVVHGKPGDLFGRLIGAEEAREEEQLYGGFTFVIESDGYTSFGDSAVRPLVQNFDASDYRFGRATHGYMPDYGPQPVFVAKGPDIKENVVLGRGRIVDEAPTYAKLLGITLPEADGHAIDEVLR